MTETAVGQFAIRPLTPDDLSEFRAIRLEGLRRFPESFLTTLAEERARPDAEVAAMLETRLILGLFDGAALIGTLALDPETAPALAHRMWINAVYLREGYHGSGLAARLLATGLERTQADGYLQAELFVAADNARAVALYRRAGFTETGRLPRAVRTPDGFVDDLHMIQRLDT